MNKVIPVIVIGLFQFSAPVLAGVFYELPDTSAFNLSGPAAKLLGHARAVATGDFDHDGDEDVIALTNNRRSEGRPNFVLYKNVSTPGDIKFDVIPNVVDIDITSFTKVPAEWDTLDSIGEESIVAGDFNNDGWPDLFIGGSVLDVADHPVTHEGEVVERSLLAINRRSPTTVSFVDVGGLAGLTDTSYVCQGAAAGDFNRDGILDIFMATSDSINSGTGNSNGRPFMFMSTGSYGTTTYDDSLITYPILADSSSTWIVPEADENEETPIFPTFFYAASACDFDADGDLDIYVCRRPRIHCPEEVGYTDGGATEFLTRDRLYVNQGTYFSQEASARGTANTGSGYGSAWGDFDNDGDMDFLLANNIHPEAITGEGCEVRNPNKEDENVLYESSGKAGGYTFIQHAVPDFSNSYAKQVNNGAFFFDYDLDGLQDFFIAVEAEDDDWGDMLFQQTEPGQFSERSMPEGVTVLRADTTTNVCTARYRVQMGTNGTFADFDGDGDLDLFVPILEQLPAEDIDCGVPLTRIYENTTLPAEDGPHYVVVRLKGAIRDSVHLSSNLDAVGSIARVYAGGVCQSQQVCEGGQDGSTWPLALTFGLGANAEIDSIVVDWLYEGNQSLDGSPFHQVIPGPVSVDTSYEVTIPDYIVVPGDFSVLDVQDAIDSANGGDIVVLRGEAGRTFSPFTAKSGVEIRGINSAVVNAESASVAITIPRLTTPGTRISGLTIRRYSSAGITAHSGGTYPVKIDGCVFADPAYSWTYGIIAETTSVEVTASRITYPSGKFGDAIHFYDSWDAGSSLRVAGCELVQLDSNAGGFGISVPSQEHGDVILEDNTVYGFNVGIDLNSYANTQAHISRNVVQGNGISEYGMLFNHVPSTLTAVFSENIVGGYLTPYLLYASEATPSGNLATDARLCGSGLTLNASSPCVPQNNAWGHWVGAKHEIACMSGSLSTTLSSALLPLTVDNVPSHHVALTSDFRIESGKTVTLGPGLSVLADDIDEANLGVYGGGSAYSGWTGKNEIIVKGRLLATGTASSKVVFRSSSASPTAGKWGMFYVHSGGDLKLTYADISHPINGIFAASGADTVELVNTDIDSCSEIMMNMNNRCFPTACPSVKVHVTGGHLRMNGATHGIFAWYPAELKVDGTTITGTSSGAYGIYADTMGAGSPEAEIKNCSITGLTAGTGIHVHQGHASIKNNVVENCKFGIEMLGSDSTAVEYDSVSHRGNHLAGCTTGIYVDASHAIVDSASIVSPASGVGLYTHGTSTGTYSRIRTTGGSYGVQVFSTGASTLRKSSLNAFTTNGVKYNVMSSTVLNLGAGADSGFNSVYSNESGVSKFVAVKTCGVYTALAEGNYWGPSSPSSSQFASCVDYQPYLTTAPGTFRSLSAPTLTEAAPRVFTASPNPFSGGLSLTIGVPGEEPQRVTLHLFDIAGRLVRTIVDSDLEPGEHRYEWNGADNRGARGSSGIYFARLAVGKSLSTYKLVKVR